jgi:hypothetical protein
MHSRNLPSRWRLKKLFKYLPKVGQFLWREDRPPAKAGTVAGFAAERGVWKLWVNGKTYAAHTLAWIYVYGKPPPGPLKHRNGVRDDNRIDNLVPLKQFRGAHTLDDILARCEVVGDCWHWQGGKSHGAPYLRHGASSVPVRRYIVEVLKAKSVEKGLLVTCKCGNADCVNPKHIAVYTREQLQQATAKRTKYAMDITRRAKLAMAARARSSLTMDIARQIREAEGPQRAIAKAFGVSFDTVNKIKSGKTWNEFDNPFLRLIK